MYVVMDENGLPRVGITELGDGNKPIPSSIDMKQTVIEFSFAVWQDLIEVSAQKNSRSSPLIPCRHSTSARAR